MSGFSLSSGLIIQQSMFGSDQILWSLPSANMNSTSDQALRKSFNFTTFTIDKIIVSGASISMTNAIGGFYGAASKGAPIIVAATQVYSALTTWAKVLNPALATGGTDMLTVPGVYFALTTPQGSAATADIYVVGVAFN